MFQSPGEIALQLGPISIHWYGILIATAFLVGLYVCNKVAREKGENPNYFTDLATIILVCGIIGARLYYVLFNLDYYMDDPLSIFKIWQGGLAIHGALIAGLIGGYVYTKHHKLSFLRYCDIACVGMAIGQAIGRWGNFFNSEAFGIPTDLPWKLYIPLNKRPEGFVQYDYFHPTFLYESLWNLGVFIILYFVLRKRLDKNNGALFLCYLGLYSLGRFFIEGLRTDSLMVFDTIKVAQLVSATAVIVSMMGLQYLLTKKTSPPQVKEISDKNDHS